MGLSSRLINILISQIINHSSFDKNGIVRNYKNMHISYKHKENIFTVNLSCHAIQNLEKSNLKFRRNGTNQIVFDVDRDKFIRSVLENIKEKPQLNSKPKKIVIDFSSPNIAKPFHVGHLRSTIIGNFIANINEYFNNDVVRLNYLGDWGTQFGLLQYGLESRNIAINELENPLKQLYDIYVEANKLAASDENVQSKAKQYFSAIEQGRAKLDNWRKIRAITVKELNKVYHRLGIKFDDYHWESDYNGEAIKSIMQSLERQNIITTDVSGKKVAKVKDKTVTVLKSDNSTLYLSRDIAALLDRHRRYRFDKMLYVVDNAQTDHFVNVFDIVGRLDNDCTKGCEHIKFGRIKGMSTRSGNVVFLNDILDEAKEKMFEKQKESKNTRSSAINEETCDILGTTAVIINDLKQRRQKDYVFDWDRALQSEGDSGIKLQYLHCRLWSLESNANVALPNECNPDCLNEEVIGDVLSELAAFDDILNRALIENEACIIVNYLFRLARHVNRMFNELKVKNVDHDLGAQRLLVFHSARLTIKKALEVLGVKPLYEM
ncbi:probable arginine--tRNA ligase, mitochondrial isoform X1 [Maniola jurtina]|uniref:probable arginine--tRNA ligase, mitochondrial isoform X1 n=1 Tax=Maniola jurtina TaxID=191418 RepID=UPI001E68B4FA|nr:probable arginine--tRNA ligase, mitochondrial isoform X1 [Maniola jurtina]